MKKVYQLTELEIVNLTQEQIDYYIDLECAERGIALLPPKPGPKPVFELPEPDRLVYEVCGCRVHSMEQAQRFLEAADLATLYEVDYDYPNSELKYVKSVIEVGSYYYPKIEPKKVYSKALWDDLKDSAKAQGKLIKAWNTLKDEYNAAVKDRESAAESVMEHIQTVTQHVTMREQLRREFARYLELAEGSVSIALNFLLKTKNLKAFPELLEEWEVMRDQECTTLEAPPYSSYSND